jgi:hypothetical protein
LLVHYTEKKELVLKNGQSYAISHVTTPVVTTLIYFIAAEG